MTSHPDLTTLRGAVVSMVVLAAACAVRHPTQPERRLARAELSAPEIKESSLRLAPAPPVLPGGDGVHALVEDGVFPAATVA